MRVLFFSFILLILLFIIQANGEPWRNTKKGHKKHRHPHHRFNHLDHNQRWTNHKTNNDGNDSNNNQQHSHSNAQPKHHPQPESHPQPKQNDHPKPSNSGGHPNVKQGTATWFTQDSQGSCGWWKSDNDFIVALPACIDADKYCGKKVEVSYKGKSITVEAADTCPECDQFHLDLSTSAFQALTGDLNLGLVNVEWHFVN